LGALSQPARPDSIDNGYPLGYAEHMHKGLYLQMLWAANLLNNAYYSWHSGTLREFEHPDGTLERPDPWQNAATVTIQYYFSRFLSGDEYLRAITGEGLLKTYENLFGPAWQNVQPVMPGSLVQPEFQLPFELGKAWTYTGGPHTGWGEGEPYAAVDFAPPAVVGGCFESHEWVTAVADGVIVRRSPAIAVLDLDGDSD
jgi:LasA protease